MIAPIQDILLENERRNKITNTPFNPITGKGSILERKEIYIEDFPIPTQYIPTSMLTIPLVKKLIKAGSIRQFIAKDLKVEYTEGDKQKVIEQFIRVRIKHDFCFWAAFYVYIKRKGGGEDVRFKLNRPQRRLVSKFEQLRLAGKPIRIILLKARQWGGSTVTQIYMAWLQLVHKTGLNSLIVGHVKDASTEVKDMFDRMIKQYPTSLLYDIGETYNENEPKLTGVGGMVNIQRIPQRNCKIKIGTAESPDSARGGDYNLVHCTEVGLWKKTEGKTPEQIVRSACSGVLLEPYTMIVYESTANGTGTFFHREYEAAKQGKSQFEAFFVSWYEIEQYSMDVEDINTFASWLYENRNNDNAPSAREASGRYLWWLWEQGASLEAIQWYILERMKYNDHGDMASEFPSDDVEAFVHSGARVFDKYKIEELRTACKAPRYIGDVYADKDEGADALKKIRFVEDKQGLFWVWSLPEIDEQETVKDRYLVIVDIGGRSNKADFSVIVVIDRLFMMEGGKPSVVAQWYGHIDMDILAWKAAQIASFYDNALLVIESNTIETHDKERMVDGDQSSFLLNQIKDVYPNLYARKQSEEDIINKVPRKYGFHTNVSTKPMIISTLVKVIREGLYVERDERCLDEYLTYEKRPNGSFSAVLGKHDDLLMTRAIGLHICFFEMDVPTVQTKSMTKIKQNIVVSAATI
jgi:hypothetical protein